MSSQYEASNLDAILSFHLDDSSIHRQPQDCCGWDCRQRNPLRGVGKMKVLAISSGKPGHTCHGVNGFQPCRLEKKKNVSAEWAYILFLSNKTEPIREMWQGAGRMCNASQFGAGVTWNSKQLPGPTPSFHQEENDKRIIEAKIFVHMKVAAGFDLESGSVSFFFPFFFFLRHDWTLKSLSF